jgi:hypothetical protein
MDLKTALFIQNTIPVIIRKLYAKLLGYFWKPCPRCHAYFSGAEISSDYNGYKKIDNLPLSEEDKKNFNVRWEKSDVVCPRCSREQLKEVKLRAIILLEAGNMNRRDISALIQLEAYDCSD